MQLCFLFHITIFEVTDRLTHLLQKLYKYPARYYDMMLLVDIKYYVLLQNISILILLEIYLCDKVRNNMEIISRINQTLLRNNIYLNQLPIL